MCGVLCICVCLFACVYAAGYILSICVLACFHAGIKVFLYVLAIPAIVARYMMSQPNSNPIGCFFFSPSCVCLFQIVWQAEERPEERTERRLGFPFPFILLFSFCPVKTHTHYCPLSTAITLFSLLALLIHSFCPSLSYISPHWYLNIINQLRPLSCLGCRAAAEKIVLRQCSKISEYSTSTDPQPRVCLCPTGLHRQ